MKTTCIQQLANWNHAFFHLASLHVGRWRRSCNATFRVLHRCSRSGSTPTSNTRQLNTNHYSSTEFYDFTRTFYFSRILGSNCKLHLGQSGTAWCRSALTDSKICTNHFTRRTTSAPVLCNPQRANLFIYEKYILIHRCIHTSQRANILFPPQLWLLLKPAQKLFAIIIGRSLRKWWKALPPNKQDLFKENIKRNKWKLLASFSGLGIAFILFYFTHLEENPITGRNRLLVFRKEHYNFLTKLEYEGFIEEFKDQMLPESDPRHIVVQKIIEHLTECNRDMPAVTEVKWVVHVVEKSDVNAFVLPNGQVFVFTGLLESVQDTHQLSFILAHEVAHVLLEHTAEMVSVSHFLDFLFLISLMMIWAICPLDSLAVLGQWVQSKLKEFMFDRPYGRALEAEADHVGLQLAAKACIDVRASSVFWQQMELSAILERQPQIPQWLSTHPSHENRAEHLNRLIPEALKLRENCNCPALLGPDPRLVFRDTVRKLQNLLEMSSEKGKTVLEPMEMQESGLPFKAEDKHPAVAAVIAVGN